MPALAEKCGMKLWGSQIIGSLVVNSCPSPEGPSVKHSFPFPMGYIVARSAQNYVWVRG